MTAELVAGRYRLETLIGTGGMGRVWLAADEVLRRNVAIKEVLLPDSLTEQELQELRLRTLREARAAARLSHPNVVRIYDVLYAGQRPWIVMEYIRGRSLAHVIKSTGPLPPVRAAHMGLSICSALSAAHAAGVLHRDVKPGNVLLGEDGRVVLTDFGLATYDEIGVALTQPGIIHGSPQFIAPERAQDGTSSPAADMWSLGATLYAAVEGHSPYSRPTSMATLTALATSPPDPPRQAGSLKPVLLGLLRKNPRARMEPDEVMTRLRRVIARDDGAHLRLIPRKRQGDAGPAGAPAATAGPPATTPPPAWPPFRTSPPPTQPPRPGNRRTDPAPGPTVWPAEDLAPDAGITGDRPGTADRPLVIYPEKAGRRTTSEFDSDPFVYGDPQITHRGKRTGPWVRAALVILPLLLIGTVVAAKLTTPDASGPVPTRPAPSTPAPSTPALVATWPCSPGVPGVSAGATPVPASTNPPDGRALPPGWVWYADPDGPWLAVPTGWVMSRSGATVCFHDPVNSHTLGVTVWTTPKAQPVAALMAAEASLIASGGLPGYRRVKIAKVSYWKCCAEWEYTYQGPIGPLHVMVRDNVTATGRAYAISWLTTTFDWVVNQAKYDLIATSFQPPSPKRSTAPDTNDRGLPHPSTN